MFSIWYFNISEKIWAHIPSLRGSTYAQIACIVVIEHLNHRHELKYLIQIIYFQEVLQNGQNLMLQMLYEAVILQKPYMINPYLHESRPPINK